MMDRQSSIRSRRSPHHRNKHLESWNIPIQKIIAYLKKKEIRIVRKQVFEILELFFEYSFRAQMHGYRFTWPTTRKRMELHIIKRIAPLRIQKHMAGQVLVFPEKYPGMEFVIEPDGSRFTNYGYNFVPDLEVRRAVVDFLNKNPKIAEKLIP